MLFHRIFVSAVVVGPQTYPVAPQNSSAQKINRLGLIRISGIGASSSLKFLGQHGTLRHHGPSRGLRYLIYRPHPIRAAFRSHADLLIENVALRQQVATRCLSSGVDQPLIMQTVPSGWRCVRPGRGGRTHWLL